MNKKTATPAAIVAKMKLINAMTNASLKKILKTSLDLAPTARRIPISFFLLEIEMVMKLANNKAEKTARPKAT